jgi:XTP/dITP diphosphohydrolase
MHVKQIILATNNPHKIKELRTLLNLDDLDIKSLADLPNPPQLIEDGTSFQENALRKARTVFQNTGIPSLADDSGLEVYYLNGRPGVFSARYAGENTNDERNNEKLLAEMRGVPPRRRGAQFRAVLALVGKGYEEIAEGICPGVLAESPRGTNGFGYDPIFIPDGFWRTYAELTAEEKNAISHRSKAARIMTGILKNER